MAVAIPGERVTVTVAPLSIVPWTAWVVFATSAGSGEIERATAELYAIVAPRTVFPAELDAVTVRLFVPGRRAAV